MNIYFKNSKDQKLFNNSKKLVMTFGERHAKLIMQRLRELDAVDYLADISHSPPPRLHQYSGSREGQFSVDTLHPYRLIFIPVNKPLPLLDDGGIDTKNVTEIEIVEVWDPH